MPTHIHRLIAYNNWANQGLLGFLATLPTDALDLAAAGVYGTVRETLEHFLSSELSYERHLLTPHPERAPRAGHPDLGTLQGIHDESVRRLTVLVESLPDPTARIQLDDGMRSAGTIFTQLLMHSSEHRSHVYTILGANGIATPELDSWAHGMFVNGDDWPADWGTPLDPMPKYPPPGLS